MDDFGNQLEPGNPHLVVGSLGLYGFAISYDPIYGFDLYEALCQSIDFDDLRTQSEVTKS